MSVILFGIYWFRVANGVSILKYTPSQTMRDNTAMFSLCTENICNQYDNILA